jgi:hypothetical protein
MDPARNRAPDKKRATHRIDGTIGLLMALATAPAGQAQSICIEALIGWLPEAHMATLRDNPVAWADFYKTSRWQRLRRLQLRQHAPCAFYLGRGHVTAANVVDRVEPHRGDWTAFCTRKLQSLCEPCYKPTKRQIELRGCARWLPDQSEPSAQPSALGRSRT